MEIKLKKMTLLNFQGIRNESFSFSHRTDIFGNNGTGKTTVANAFTWLLFGKDLHDRQNFEVKTLDKNNEPIHKVVHSVEALLSIDGIDSAYRRELKEKWVKKRGEAEAKMTGNTEDFFIDDVPVQKKEYQDRIGGIIHEQMFKLITNPLYFNDVIEWKKRREMLFKMAGGVTISDIAKDNPKYLAILSEVESKTIDGLRKVLLARRKKLNEILKEIPTRIDEISRDIPAMPNEKLLKDTNITLTNELEGLRGNIEAINATTKQYQEKLSLLNRELNVLNSKRSSLKSEAAIVADNENNKFSAEKRKAQYSIGEKEDAIRSHEAAIKSLTASITLAEQKREEIRAKGQEIRSRVFDESGVDMVCPVCKQQLPEDEVAEKINNLLENFNAANVAEFNKLVETSTEYKNEITEMKSEISAKQLVIGTLKKEIGEIEETVKGFDKPIQPVSTDDVLNRTDEYRSLVSKIKEKQDEINSLVSDAQDTETASAQKHRQAEIEQMLRDNYIQLSKIDDIKTKKARIATLEEESKQYAQQIAEIEGEEYLLEQLSRDYISGVESKIESIFTGIKFRMFKTLVNGGTEEDCTLILDGVPWSDINSAGKIKAGLSCIDTIGKHYEYSAPVFIDNAESIVELPDINSQLIRLIVSEKDNKLRTINN